MLRTRQLADIDPEGQGLPVTFDAALGQDDPDLHVLELAHPLVRRLVELVKDKAAGQELGRFAARATPEAQEVTAIAHVLARYVTASDPPVVLEELIPVAYPVYREGRSPQDPLALLRAPLGSLAHTTAEISEAGYEALNNPSLATHVEEVIEAKRDELEKRQSTVAAIGAKWTAGADVLEVVSKDLLTLTVVFPVHGS